MRKTPEDVARLKMIKANIKQSLLERNTLKATIKSLKQERNAIKAKYAVARSCL